MPYPIAYQLYSSRNFPPLAAQLPILKAMGYDAIEPWLPAYDADPNLFRRQLDDAGLACYGFHMPLAGLVNEPNRYIEIAQTLGATTLIPPYIAPDERQPTPDFYRALGQKLATGDGIINWGALVPLFRATTADHIVAEHDNPSDWQAFAQRSIDYMRKLGL